MASPFYDAGYEDGTRDAAASAGKDAPVVNLDPTKSWSIMYRKGYVAAHPASGIDPYDVQDRPETGWKRQGMSQKQRRKAYSLRRNIGGHIGGK